MEPVLVLDWAQIEHPMLNATFRDLGAVIGRLACALEDGPYLLGADYSSVDLLLSSPFQAMSDALPQEPSVRAWIERCAARPAVTAAMGRRAA